MSKPHKTITLSIPAKSAIKKLEATVPQFNFSAECEKLVFELKKRHKIK